MEEKLEVEGGVLAVQVAIHVRPLLPHEEEQGCTASILANESEKTVTVPSSECRMFTFDHVFQQILEGIQSTEVITPSSTEKLYSSCVAPMVKGCFDGLNATVFAYGQTGSGKTFTMSSESGSVIPRVARDLFLHMNNLTTKLHSEGKQHKLSLSVSFFEIYREELFDLLSPSTSGNGALAIREDASRNLFVAGLSEVDVQNEEDLMNHLLSGCKNRATGSTQMNRSSSRSHAIFSISVRNEDLESGITKTAKFHLVDLAGSERAKRTKAEGDRLKEGIDINRGLLALGNVISALGDDSKKGALGHIPYRDSKLTRILQDSLGGNSRTLMIACISPADINFEETINTLKYANRARNIQNKPITNNQTDGAGNKELVDRLRKQIAALQEQLRVAKTEKQLAITPKPPVLETCKVFMRLSERNSQLELKLSKLAEWAKSIKAPELAEHLSKMLDSSDLDSNFNESNDSEPHATEETERAASPDNDDLDTGGEEAESSQDDFEEQQFERQVALQNELQNITDELELKIQAVEQFERSDKEFEGIRAAYSRTIEKMCEELSLLQTERDDLLNKLEDERKSGGAGSEKERVLKQKLSSLVEKHEVLKKKQGEQERLSKIHAKDARGIEKLKAEIIQLKQAKVKLVRRIKDEAEACRKWKQDHDKEMKQMKRKEQKQKYQYLVLERMHSKQQAVLKRKQEEATLAQKKLHDLLAKQRAASKQSSDHLPFLENAASGTHKSDFEDTFTSWLDEQAQFSFSLREARRALESELSRRQGLAKEKSALNRSTNGQHSQEQSNSLSMQLEACSEHICQLQASILEGQEATSKSNHAWGQIRNTHQAKKCLRVLHRKFTSSHVEAESLRSQVSQLIEDNNDLQRMFLEMEHDFIVQRAEIERDFQEKLVFALSSKIENVPEELSRRVEALQDESERLVEFIRSERPVLASPGSSKAATKKTTKKAIVPATYESDDYVSNFSESSENEDSADDDDEDWTEDSPARKKKRKANQGRKQSTGASSIGSFGIGLDTSPSKADVVAVREAAEEQLPADLVARIEKFKVKELQDALSLLGQSVTGRKEVLRARLFCGLLEKQRELESGKDEVELLPESLPDRHGSKRKEESTADKDGTSQNLKQDLPIQAAVSDKTENFTSKGPTQKKNNEDHFKEVTGKEPQISTVGTTRPPIEHQDRKNQKVESKVALGACVGVKSSEAITSGSSKEKLKPPLPRTFGGRPLHSSKVQERRPIGVGSATQKLMLGPGAPGKSQPLQRAASRGKENDQSLNARLAEWRAQKKQENAPFNSSKPRKALGQFNRQEGSK